MSTRPAKPTPWHFEVLVSGPVAAERLRVSYRPDLSMPRNESVDRWIESAWEMRKRGAERTSTPMFNGSLFRLGGHFLEPETGLLRLLLGPTDYKDYVGTRMNGFFAGRWREELANPLAVCCVVETSDGFLLVGRRKGVDVYAGRFHIPGGFADRPEEFDGQGRRGPYVPDLQAELRREVLEETGLAIDGGPLNVLGLLYDLDTPHPELAFHAKLEAGLEEARARLRSVEQPEVEDYQLLPTKAQELASFLREHHGKISVTGQGALMLFGRLRFGEAWQYELERSLLGA